MATTTKLGFWWDFNPGSPPTGSLIAKHIATGVDADHDVTSSAAALKAAAKANKRATFNTEMATHSFWSALSTAKRDCLWASARYLWK